MNIGVDLDDVLADFVLEFKCITNRLFGKPLDINEEPVDWNWSNYKLTQEELGAAWQVVSSTNDFWTKLWPEPGASPSMYQELCRAHNVFHVTARAFAPGMTVKDQSAAWLKQEFGVEFPTVIVSMNKGPICAALELDYFIDDRPKNCIEVKQALPNCKVYVKDASHNQDFSHPEIARVKNFDEFAGLILGGERVGSSPTEVESLGDKSQGLARCQEA